MANDEYGTPFWLYSNLNDRFAFELDPCAKPSNVLGTPTFFTKEDDGLAKSWGPGPVFMNPPYSLPHLWAAKAHRESLKGVLVVGLMRADPSTRWWNSWVKGKALVLPVPFRIRFEGATGAYNFPNAILIWHGLFQGEQR